MKALLGGTVVLLLAAFAVLLGWSMLDLPAPAERLPEQVAAQLDASGVSHPVTAVLLNFRGYDTLLEIAVLLLALLGVLSAGSGESRQLAPPHPHRDPPLLPWLTRLLVPLMLLAAGYLLWAGAHRPGGAFQAGAVVAAAGVLLHLSHLVPTIGAPGFRLRAGLTFGFLVFLAVAAAVMLQGTLLQYPQAWAKALILGVEAGLTLSIGLILASLFLSLSGSGKEWEW